MSEAAVAPLPTEPRPPAEGEDSKPAATETPLSPSSVEHRYDWAGNADDEDDDVPKDDDVADEEGAKEEEELFTSIEKEHEGEGMAEQPKEVTAAPKLLQSALSAGEVKEESDEEKKDNGEGAAEGGAEKVVAKPHVHQRVRLALSKFQSCGCIPATIPFFVSLLSIFLSSRFVGILAHKFFHVYFTGEPTRLFAGQSVGVF